MSTSLPSAEKVYAVLVQLADGHGYTDLSGWMRTDRDLFVSVLADLLRAPSLSPARGPRGSTLIDGLVESWTNRRTPTRDWAAANGLRLLGVGNTRDVFEIPGHGAVKFERDPPDGNLAEIRIWREAPDDLRRWLVPVTASDPDGRWLVMPVVVPGGDEKQIPSAVRADMSDRWGLFDFGSKNVTKDGKLLDYGSAVFHTAVAAPVIARSNMDLPTAIAWMKEQANFLVSATEFDPKTGNMLEDERGASMGTYANLNQYLSQIDELADLDPDVLPIDIHQAAIDTLRIHAGRQIDTESWRQARDAVAAVYIQQHPEEAPALNEPGRKPARIFDPNRSADSGLSDGGGYRFDGSRKFASKFPIRRSGPKVNELLYAARIPRHAYRWEAMEGGTVRNWLVADVSFVEAIAAAVEEHYPVLAAALRQNAPVWRMRAGVEALEAAPPTDGRSHAPAASTAGPAVPLSLVRDPTAGSVAGVRWEWSRDRPREVLLLMSSQNESFAMSDAIPGATPRYRAGSYGTEYWRAYPVEGLAVGFDALEARGIARQALPVLRALLVGEWSTVASSSRPAVGSDAHRQATALMRRYLHMLDDTVKADPEAVQRAIEEVALLLGAIRPGVQTADLGIWGRWQVGTDSSTGRKVVEFHGVPRACVGWHKGVPGAMARQSRDGTWYNLVALKKIPAAARALDRCQNIPLAMSLRVALLTDALLGDTDDQARCLMLEALASSHRLEDIPDAKARAVAEQIIGRLRFPGKLFPYPYQQIGIAYAMLSGFRCLIGDDPGLGKTPQGIGCLVADPEHTLPALVVAPKSIIMVWHDHIAGSVSQPAWAPHLRPIVVERADDMPRSLQGNDVVIVPYSMLSALSDLLLRLPFKLMICDESTYTKTPTAQVSQAARVLAHKIPGCVLLSGTALENKPIDLYHQLHMIDPDQFSSAKEFKARFGQIGKRAVVGPAGDLEVYDDQRDNPLDELRDQLRCVMVRRLKAEVLTMLPSKTRDAMWIRLPAAAMAAYQRVEAEMEAWACKALHDRLLVVASKAYARLAKAGVEGYEAVRQAVQAANADPPDMSGDAQFLANINRLRALAGEAKVPAAIEFLTEFVATGQPLVVTAWHQNVLQAMGRALNEAKVRWTLIDGSIADARERQNRVDQFQGGSVDVILLSKAGFQGITLTRASHMLHTERWWVPSWEDQIEDRLHRIGQLNAVFIHRLMARDTIDEKMDQAVEEKREVRDDVMGASAVAQANRDVDMGASAVTAGLAQRFAAGVVAKLRAGAMATSCTITEPELVAYIRAHSVEVAT